MVQTPPVFHYQRLAPPPKVNIPLLLLTFSVVDNIHLRVVRVLNRVAEH